MSLSVCAYGVYMMLYAPLSLGVRGCACVVLACDVLCLEPDSADVHVWARAHACVRVCTCVCARARDVCDVLGCLAANTTRLKAA